MLNLPQDATWAPIPDFFAAYFVSDDGRIISFQRNKPRVLKPSKDKDGYLYVMLAKPIGPDGPKYVKRYVHRLVCSSFYGEYPLDEHGEPFVTDHLNFDVTDNRLENLRPLPRSVNAGRKRHNSPMPSVTVH